MAFRLDTASEQDRDKAQATAQRHEEGTQVLSWHFGFVPTFKKTAPGFCQVV
jgi:hypothetical protein